jgi:hypothetical protein
MINLHGTVDCDWKIKRVSLRLFRRGCQTPIYGIAAETINKSILWEYRELSIQKESNNYNIQFNVVVVVIILIKNCYDSLTKLMGKGASLHHCQGTAWVLNKTKAVRIIDNKLSKTSLLLRFPRQRQKHGVWSDRRPNTFCLLGRWVPESVQCRVFLINYYQPYR